MLRTLSESYRRRILREMADRSREDRFEPETFVPTGTDGDERRSLQTELLHIHLPKLDDGEFVDWNRDAGEIRRGRNFDEIVRVLDRVLDSGDGSARHLA
ncbi:hypothetical protein ACFQE1_19630 [Halobium palmae]|uniref:DUF7344 domain-containing protein n=1 Tax=Halobium palmae TaxID=1776492 RepID=A0ABD5S4H0_9EURY